MAASAGTEAGIEVGNAAEEGVRVVGRREGAGSCLALPEEALEFPDEAA